MALRKKHEQGQASEGDRQDTEILWEAGDDSQSSKPDCRLGRKVGILNMLCQSTVSEDLIVRIERLERQHRRVNLASKVVVVMGSCVFFMAQVKPPSQALEVERIVFRNVSGQIVGTLGATKHGLDLLDSQGKTRLSLGGFCCVEDNGLMDYTSFNVHDQKGFTSFEVTAQDKFTSVSMAPRPLTKNRTYSPISLMVDSSGPVIVVRDETGFFSSIGVTDLLNPKTGETSKTSAASIVMFDKERAAVWKAPR